MTHQELHLCIDHGHGLIYCFLFPVDVQIDTSTLVEKRTDVEYDRKFGVVQTVMMNSEMA